MRYVALAPLKFRNLEVKTGDTFIPKNEDAIRPLLDNGRVRIVRDVLTEKYKEFCKWLGFYPVTVEDIERHFPWLLKAIHNAINEMDNHFLNENLQGFNESMEKVKRLYLEAVRRIIRWENLGPSQRVGLRRAKPAKSIKKLSGF